jgi:alkylation response protein AidB-like acyl-CoA dehydrogenase
VSSHETPNLRDVLPGIRSRADRYDVSGDWPAEDLHELARIGAMRWAIPASCGGEELSPIELHYRYEAIAAASLTAALILTQRDSAVGILSAGENTALRDELLPKLAENEIFATVGIAQLTTSRQTGPPALLAQRAGDGWQVDGLIPWSTGAGFADVIVAGAALDGSADQQILFALPRNAAGVTIEPPMPLVALRASHTESIQCQGVRIENHSVIRGPVPAVLSGRKRVLPTGQAFLALGLCCGGIELIRAHDSSRAQSAAQRFEDELRELRSRVLDASSPAAEQTPACDPQHVAELRGQCNDLALRITHAAVAIYKGSGLLAGHPAQRLAREAMFLLVWSCPNPVIDCTVEILSGGTMKEER